MVGVTLVALPAELKNAIFEKLDKSDLLNICLSSKSMHKAGVYTLYRNVLVSQHQIEKLLRTLIERPEYAAHVKALSIGGYIKTCLGPLHDTSTVYEHAMISRALNELGVKEPTVWEENIEKHNVNAVTALTIGQCPKLQSLVYETHPLDSWFLEIVADVWTNPGNASSLTSVSLLDGDTPPCFTRTQRRENPGRFRDFLKFLYLPQIEELRVVIPWLEPDDMMGGFWPLPNCSDAQHLRKLDFVHSGVSPQSLGRILQRTPNLQELYYSFDSPSSNGTIKMGDLRDALTPVETHLLHLTVKLDIFPDEAVEEIMLPNVLHERLGSLQAFSSLRGLNMPLFAVYGQINNAEAQPLIEMLPSQIKHLTVNNSLWEFRAFQDWIENPALSLLEGLFTSHAFRDHLPNLQEFVFDLDDKEYLTDDFWEKGNDAHTRLETACKKQGVSFELLAEDLEEEEDVDLYGN
ncbi:hypothetical protein BS50DRAFT_576708 [Corynespora cassiicola Philippines]|uniref:F-box domain-containing protein n=1 Tax=Corynespora cassiicola Philippines TaxID=1448308 RepID=A0A2T2NF80_CORCC|nr:hypothetical protein BS50DRAFT_576708 [Corynespora cassiicola Philippines]